MPGMAKNLEHRKSIRLDHKLRQQAERYAKKNDLDFSRVVRLALRDFFAQRAYVNGKSAGMAQTG
jgi:predicted transcriptional regulator